MRSVIGTLQLASLKLLSLSLSRRIGQKIVLHCGGDGEIRAPHQRHQRKGSQGQDSLRAPNHSWSRSQLPHSPIRGGLSAFLFAAAAAWKCKRKSSSLAPPFFFWTFIVTTYSPPPPSFPDLARTQGSRRLSRFWLSQRYWILVALARTPTTWLPTTNTITKRYPRFWFGRQIRGGVGPANNDSEPISARPHGLGQLRHDKWKICGKWEQRSCRSLPCHSSVQLYRRDSEAMVNRKREMPTNIRRPRISSVLFAVQRKQTGQWEHGQNREGVEPRDRCLHVGSAGAHKLCGIPAISRLCIAVEFWG